MVSIVLAVFGCIGIGFAARRANWLTHQADKSLIDVVVSILMPALILDRTLGNPLLLQPANVILPPLVGFATVVGGFAIALLLGKTLARATHLTNPSHLRTFALCVGLYNYSYVPLPLAEQFFGPDTVAVLFVHNLGVEIALWTAGLLLISGHLGRQWYRHLLNGPTLAIAAAIFLNFSHLHAYVPSFLTQIFHLLGPAAIPLALLLVGATVADELHGAQVAQGLPTMTLAVVLRILLLPILFLLLAWLLPASLELKRVIALQAAMPAAVFPIILARHYGGHPQTAIRVVLATALLSFVTTPLWLLTATRLLHLSPRW